MPNGHSHFHLEISSIEIFAIFCTLIRGDGGGATSAEQAALTARINAVADKLETADKALTTLGEPPPAP